jgi:hypothetical protein
MMGMKLNVLHSAPLANSLVSRDYRASPSPMLAPSIFSAAIDLE